MANLPQAKAGKMFGRPVYKVNGKLAVSAFDKLIVYRVLFDEVVHYVANQVG